MLAFTFAKKDSVLKGISGNKIIWGASSICFFPRPAEAAIHPACRPITSRINTLVEVADIQETSKAASCVEIAIYFATEPKPGQLSVKAKSLSIVFGRPIQTKG